MLLRSLAHFFVPMKCFASEEQSLSMERKQYGLKIQFQWQNLHVLLRNKQQRQCLFSFHCLFNRPFIINAAG